MKRNVRIKICGRQCLNGESDETIVEATGRLEKKEAVLKLEYDENSEDGSGIIYNIITISARGIKIEKRGALVSDLFFVENKVRTITYRTSYGVLSMESRCKRIQVQENESQMNIRIEYDLYASNELISECITEISTENTEAS